MAHTSTLLLTHLVFFTKERRPWLDDAVRAELFAYLGGIERESGALPPWPSMGQPIMRICS